jgi:glycerol kinase
VSGPLYLCLDQGGHASRALVFDGAGRLRAGAVETVATRRPAADRVEQDADELVATLERAAVEALTALGERAADLAASGLATQRSTVVCWDRDTGAALTPAISWQDRRAAPTIAALEPHAAAIRARTGLMLSPHYGASKLRWCLDESPAVRRAADAGRLAAGPLASFLLQRLLAERPCLADPANAARTLLWNIEARDWDEELLAVFGIPRAALPACVASRHAFGTLEVAGRRTPLTVATGDQSAALFAAGAPDERCAYLNLGTGAFAQRPTAARPCAVEGLLSAIAFHDPGLTQYALEGTVNGAGAALDWARAALGAPDLDQRLGEWLARDDEPPLFLNGVGGLGTPYWIADFPSRFVGEGDAAHKAAAVAESIVFLLMVNLELLQTLQTEQPLERLLASGGLALDGLCQRLADLSGLPLERPDEREATARGLAWLLAGGPRDWEQSPRTNFRPAANPALHARYERWREALARALGELLLP